MTLSEIEGLLRRTMGLDPASISSAMVERAVRNRIQACGLDWAGYGERLRASPEELHELIEGVVVPETWFFREREAFGLLARRALEEWTRNRPDGVARLLSLPCSTGEEPYSMAMALLDAGLPADRFRIDAIDISRHSLALARKGRYGRNSFRGDDLSFRDRHFSAEGRVWTVAESVRTGVRFREGNLFDPALLQEEAPYDAVFCRNVLIYFDRPGQEAAVEALRRKLTAEGLLFVGPSEASLASERGFVPVRVPQAFAFRKAEPPAVKAVPPSKRVPVPAPTPKAATATTPLPFASVAAAPRMVETTQAAPSDDLGAARRLADQGKLAEALQLCEAHLRAHGPSASAYHLMGIAHDALRRHGEAAAFYRKALYLEPENHEVLLHLASLLESQGDGAGARVLNERARRVAAKQGN